MTSRAPALLFAAFLVTASGCDPVYDDVVPTPGTYSTCCRESTLQLDTHLASEGEKASHRIFPGCECNRGPQCSPMYIVTASGCSVYAPVGYDAGVTVPSDGGVAVDAGVSSDGGVTDAGVSFDGGAAKPDAGAPGEWAACCVSGRIAPCLCPAVGTCTAAEFTPCGGGTCTTTGVCVSR